MSLPARFWSAWSQNLRGDLFGGITSAVVALPLALAFGVLSGAGAAAGLYSAIFAGIIASLFGGAPAQITGPTGGMTVVLVVVYKELGVQGLFMAMFMAGLIQIGLSLLKVGRYIHFIPHPVIVGFTNGIAILIFSQQLSTLRNSDGTPNWAAVSVAVAVLAIMFVWPRITRTVPGSLVALLLTTILSVLYLSGQVTLIGEIPSTLPRPNPAFLLEHWQDTLRLIRPALMIALLGAIESLLAAVVVDEMAGTRHHSDRELFGQGLANAVAALFGGIAGTGAIVRSAVNVKAGGRTRVSGVLHGLIILLVTVALGRYAAMIPLATLSGILMATSFGMVDWESLREIRRAPPADAAVMLTTAGLTVFTDLVLAVSVGVALSVVIFTGKMARTPVLIRRAGKAVIVSLSGPLFFGTAHRLLDTVERAEPANCMILDLSEVTSTDHSGAVFLHKASRAAESRGGIVFWVGLQVQVREVLERLGLLESVRPEQICATVDSALSLYQHVYTEDSNALEPQTAE